MKTLRNEKGFKLTFNGSNTFMIIDNNGTCWEATNTLRKANNRMNKILSCYN